MGSLYGRPYTGHDYDGPLGATPSTECPHTRLAFVGGRETCIKCGFTLLPSTEPEPEATCVFGCGRVLSPEEVGIGVCRYCVIPDLTPVNGPWCDAEDPKSGAVCTRLPGHTRRHAAGNGLRLVAVWCSNDCDGGWIAAERKSPEFHYITGVSAYACCVCNPDGRR